MEEFLRRFQRLGFGTQPAPPAPALDTGELEKLIRSAVRSALSEPPEQAVSRENGEPGGERPRKGKAPRGEENGEV